MMTPYARRFTHTDDLGNDRDEVHVWMLLPMLGVHVLVHSEPIVIDTTRHDAGLMTVYGCNPLQPKLVDEHSDL